MAGESRTELKAIRIARRLEAGILKSPYRRNRATRRKGDPVCCVFHVSCHGENGDPSFLDLLMYRPSGIFRVLSTPGCIAGSLLLAGCVAPKGVTQTPSVAAKESSGPDAPKSLTLPPGYVPVLRQGRYTLVELSPGIGQRDLTRQIVDARLPLTVDTTVGDALNYILLRSGYRLCAKGDAALLYVLPLPAAHMRLGPMTLREALLTLAGPAWELSVDDASRTVCFNRHVEPLPPNLPAPPVTSPPSSVQSGKPASALDLHPAAEKNLP